MGRENQASLFAFVANEGEGEGVGAMFTDLSSYAHAHHNSSGREEGRGKAEYRASIQFNAENPPELLRYG